MISNPIQVFLPSGIISGKPDISSSKSESNRALMLKQFSNGLLQINNLSTAQDTQLLNSLLQSKSDILNARDGGTTFRFLASYLAISNRTCILTGSSRMRQRPISNLVSSLRILGANIKYLENEGFPPLQFNGFAWTGVSEIEIEAMVSSQFISSLMMAAPVLPNGLTIHLKGDRVSSMPYLKMTQGLMEKMGIEMHFDDRVLSIPNQDFKLGSYTIESDWSAASYWFAMVALAKKADVFLPNLREDSLQGDMAILDMVKPWGVHSTFENGGLRLQKIENHSIPQIVEHNFLNTPDLAQTMVVLCAVSGTRARFTGMQSLAIKESHRLMALQMELRKVGIEMAVNEKEGTCFIPEQELEAPTEAFETYNDHRMAMALSILAVRFPIQINHPEVVTKSYPGFWTAIQSTGFQVTEQVGR